MFKEKGGCGDGDILTKEFEVDDQYEATRRV